MSKKQICLIPYAHLDTQWRWEYPTTIKKYIKNTIDDNIAMMRKYPEYVFNFCGAIRYQMMRDYYPDGFLSVKKHVADGQWRLAGTCLDETDAIVPSVESLIRNVLYGRQWQLREFGVTSSDYMLPDCFGFPSNFPTVLKHCGIVGFSTQKLSWGSAVGIPFELGKWRGADGSELLSALNPGSYVGQLSGLVQLDEDRVKKLNSLGEKNGVWKSFQYYGVGDMGGAPDENSIKNALKSKSYCEDNSTDIQVIQSGADQFFKNVSADESAMLDTYIGDLLLTQHSAGSLSSQAIMKRWNRQNEQLAFAAEYYAILAEKVSGLPYPHDRIAKAWQRVIGNQMHDILPGTCTPTAYEYSYNDEVLALKEWRKIIDDSIAAIAPHIGGDGNIILVNPHESQRVSAIELNLQGLKVDCNYQLKGSDGQLSQCQVKSCGGVVSLIVMPKLEPFQIKAFSLVEGRSAESDLKLCRNSGDYVLSNANLMVKVSEFGEIYSIIDKNSNKEWLKSPIAYHVLGEHPSQYPAWNMDWKDRKKSPKKVVTRGAVEIVEDGVIRKTLRITTLLGKSKLVKELSLSAHAETLDCVERIDWSERGVSLKLAINANVASPTLFTNWETCQVPRGVNNEKLYEMPSRYWVDLKNDKEGLSILENCKYGYDRPDVNTVRMTLLYTPKGAIGAKFYDQRCQDFGRHVIKYSIYPHGANGSVDNLAKALNRQPLAYKAEGAREDVKELRLFEVDGNRLGVLAVKKSEDDSGYIIRLYNRECQDVTARVVLYGSAISAWQVNGIEESMASLDMIDGGVTVNVQANAICSLLIKTDTAHQKTPQQSARIECSGRLIGEYFPKEQILEQITSGNLIFNVASAAESNSMPCNGQSIELGGGYSTLSILVASKNNCNLRLMFACDQKSIAAVDTAIMSCGGFVGQFDKVVWRLKPRLHEKFKRDYLWLNRYKRMKNGNVTQGKIAHYTTHTHNDGQDQYYGYGYIQQLDIPIPNGADSVIFPTNEAINILAVTLSLQKATVVDIAAKVDEFEI